MSSFPYLSSTWYLVVCVLSSIDMTFRSHPRNRDTHQCFESEKVCRVRVPWYIVQQCSSHVVVMW